MVDFSRVRKSRGALAAGGAALVILGAAGGASAVQATRPAIEMAPTVRTPIARLATTSGVVTVKGRVAEVYGDRFVVQDPSGRTMVAAGREGRGAVSVGQPVMVQGRFDDGQLRASYLVDGAGQIATVGPRGPRPGGPDGHGPRDPGRDGPGRDGPPPPPPGCAPVPGGPAGPGAVPPPPPPPPGTGNRPGAGGIVPPPPPPGGQAGPAAPPAPAPAAASPQG